MTLPLTPDMLIGAYEFLRTTPPFKRWHLPHADEVEFRVIANARAAGKCVVHYDGRAPIIHICPNYCDRTERLVFVLAHEMTHLRQFSLPRPGAEHGGVFKRLAAQVCSYHGFDPKEFQ